MRNFSRARRRQEFQPEFFRHLHPARTVWRLADGHHAVFIPERGSATRSSSALNDVLKSPAAVRACDAAATHRVALRFNPDAHAPGGGRNSSPNFFAFSVTCGISGGGCGFCANQQIVDGIVCGTTNSGHCRRPVELSANY